MIQFKCSKCGEGLEAPESLRGQTVQCPKCELHEKVPVFLLNEEIDRAKRLATKTESQLVKLWVKSPRAFRNGFLGALGAIAAIWVGLQIYNFSPIGSGESKYSLTSIEKRLQEKKLFFISTQAKTFRARRLQEHRYSPDANYDLPSLSLWADKDNSVVGISARWRGTRNGLATSTVEDTSSFKRNSQVVDGFQSLIDIPMYFPEEEFKENKKMSSEYLTDVYEDWTIQVDRFPSILQADLTIHKILSSDPKVYEFLITATNW